VEVRGGELSLLRMNSLEGLDELEVVQFQCIRHVRRERAELVIVCLDAVDESHVDGTRMVKKSVFLGC
jgi:hypothetical protein